MNPEPNQEERSPLVGGYYDQEDVVEYRSLILQAIGEEQLQELLADIERGTSVAVAVSKHLPQKTHEELYRSDPGYRELVRKASASARALAEQTVFATRPDLWLLKGPGGRGENGAGWGDRAEVTASVKVEASLDLSKLSTEELETLARLLDRAAPQEAELVKSSVDTR